MAHIHDKIDFTVSVYIVFEGKVLLHKHKVLKRMFPVGGHIELDEDPNEAAIREAKEEAGLDIELVGKGTDFGTQFRSRDLVPPAFLNRHYYNEERTHEHVDLTYFARTKHADARPEEEGGEIRWFTKEEVEKNDMGLLADVRAHALAALAALA